MRKLHNFSPYLPIVKKGSLSSITLSQIGPSQLVQATSFEQIMRVYDRQSSNLYLIRKKKQKADELKIHRWSRVAA